MKSEIIRQKFFDFFVRNGHTKVASSALIPAQDPTLLFTNAGMNQFKDLFLGKETRNYVRAVSIQKCMRAGGKHSDLDNVGFTNRHLTFFEMLGNFSFGDYFKKDAIRFAWDFLTKELNLNADNLYVTVFREDDEAYTIWHKEVGLPQTKISRLDEKDNFWQMGDTGPCGPCTEIYVDRGNTIGCKRTACAPGCSCDRYLEIWNLVFMQFDRQENGTDLPLTKTGVDTGMGLERLCLIMQQKNSIFEIDLFEPVIARIEQLTGVKYAQATEQQRAAFHVLCDHIRSVTFLITDGATPSNDGRGYVLRKIIRRAALFAQKLGDSWPVTQLVDAVVMAMKAVYPELVAQQEAVKKILAIEIEKFAHNLVHGQHFVQQYLQEQKTEKIITGQQAFKLYDTYGFPLELTRVIAHEHNFTVDTDAFDALMEKQREISGSKETAKKELNVELPQSIATEFVGFQQLTAKTGISALIVDNQLVNEVKSGVACWIITQQSPFYVEKGGQISDHCYITINSNKARVTDLKRVGNAIAAAISAPTNITIGQEVLCEVDKQFRTDVMNNHTATHLLQSALIATLGKQVRQSGSLVHPDYLRFDFTYHQPLTHEQIKQVEDLVNEKIRENISLHIYETTYEDAVAKGVIAIFGEKYNPEKVRVIDITEFSRELCGGTHVRATGDIGCFKITQETSLSTGQRRIFALTGRKAVDLLQQNFDVVKSLSTEFKVQDHEIVQAVEKQQAQLKNLQTTIKQLKKENLTLALPALINQIATINEIPVGIFNFKDVASQELKDIAQVIAQYKNGFYVITTHDLQQNKSSIFVQLSEQYVANISLKKFAAWLLATFNFKAGGKDNQLQGGGAAINFDDFKSQVVQWLQNNIQ